MKRGFVGGKVFCRKHALAFPMHCLKTYGGSEALTTTFKKCGVQTTSGGEECYTLETYQELLRHKENMSLSLYFCHHQTTTKRSMLDIDKMSICEASWSAEKPAAWTTNRSLQVASHPKASSGRPTNSSLTLPKATHFWTAV